MVDFDHKQALEFYAKRWEIETLFGCLKSKGFQLEDTHLTCLNRVQQIFCMLALAFAWAYRVGVWGTQLEPIKIKKHGRKAQSLFRYGLDWLEETFF